MREALHTLSYVDAEKALQKAKVVLLPIGSIEQHGPANPLGTDMLIAEKLANAAADLANVPVLPVIPYGISHHHMGFFGTITVSEKALEAYVFDVLKSLTKWGIKNVVIVNGHGGNLPVLQILSRRAREELGIKVFVYQWWTYAPEILSELFDNDELGHAGSAETSLMMYLYPEYVQKDRLLDEVPRGELGGGRLYTFNYTHELSRSGVFGRQTGSSAERGKALFEKLVAQLMEIIEKITSEEQHGG